MVCQARRLRWRLAVGAVNAAEVEMRDEQGDGVAVVLVSLGEAQGQPGKASVKKPHAQIGPLCVTGVDL